MLPEREALLRAAAEVARQAAAPSPAHPAPSISVALFDTQGLLALETSGSPERTGVAPDAATVYRIASMSKSFLAAAALRAEEEGLFDLDAPLSEVLPYVSAVRWQGRPQPITARMLLSNRSGLPEDNAWGDRHLGISVPEFEQIVAAGLRATFPADTVYQYSNVGFTLVGRALERTTHMPIEEYVRSRLLEPLGLGDTAYDRRELPGRSVAPGWRSFDSGRSWVPEPFLEPGALGCIGGLFSTAGDVATWARFLVAAFPSAASRLSPEELDRFDRVLSPASRRAMQVGRTPIHTLSGARAGALVSSAYALGLESDIHRDLGAFAGHSGGLPGFSSHMRWHLATGIGAVVFANTDNFPAREVATEALERFLSEAGAPAAEVPLWPETVAAIREVDAAIRSARSLAEVADRFAPNVFQDRPLKGRDRAAAQLLKDLGGVQPALPNVEARLLAAPTPAEASWRIPCARGDAIVGIRLMGVEPPLVEGFWIGRGDRTGTRLITDTPKVTDGYLPVVSAGPGVPR
ncbi:MAG: beta-lactamase family protein [Microbacteriaceae bacterium]|jgi:CubicO group peptidase (beta-lactamase class C family)|nr:beta-lactamase family protein [Microbacteriaceae bacterium]